MDNGALIFIIILEAMVIVWQASKLKQYHKFATLLDGGSSRSPSSTQSSDELPAEQSSKVPSARALEASNAVAGSLSAPGIEDEELLDMPGVDPENNIEEAKRVQLVMARCRYAEFYLEQLDDDYERGQFEQIVTSCKNTVKTIEDPFFRSSALQPLILLLDRAEWSAQRDRLLAEVDDELIKQQISESLS